MLPTVLLMLLLQTMPKRQELVVPHLEYRGDETVFVIPKGWSIEIDHAYIDFEGKTLKIGGGCTTTYTLPTYPTCSGSSNGQMTCGTALAPDTIIPSH